MLPTLRTRFLCVVCGQALFSAALINKILNTINTYIKHKSPPTPLSAASNTQPCPLHVHASIIRSPPPAFFTSVIKGRSLSESL